MAIHVFQVTVSGKDSGGYLWQNVIHVAGTFTDLVGVDGMEALATYIDTGLVAAMVEAKAESNTILNIGVKEVLPGTSFTYNHAVNEPGARSGTENVGAIAGKITEYPSSGILTGRIFLNGCLDTDFDADVITPTYLALLEGVADAMNLIDGSEPTNAWELVIWHTENGDYTTVDECVAVSSPGVLSKRVRG